MKVKRSELVGMFEAMEFKTASKWNRARLLGKVNSLPDFVDDDTDAGDSQDLLDNLLDAVAKEDDIVIVDDVEKAGDKKKTTKKKGAKPAKKPAKKKGAKEETEKKPVKKKGAKPAAKKVDRDRFGSKPGTQCAEINAVMTGKVQTTKEIAEASGMTTSRVKAHMTYLVSKEFVEKKDKGYKVAKKK